MCKTVKRYVIFCVPQTPSVNFQRPHATRSRRMRSFQSPYSLMRGDLLRETPSRANPAAPPAILQWVPNSPASPDSGRPFVTTPQGCLPRPTGRQMEAFLSPSSPDEGPPRMSSAEKGRDPNYKVKASVTFGNNIGASLLQNSPFLLTARWRADSSEETVRPGLFPAQDLPVQISFPALRPWPSGLRKWSSSPPGRRDSRFPPY